MTRIEIVPLYLETYNGYGISAIARLRVGESVIAYAGGSRYASTCAETLFEAFAETLSKIMADALAQEDQAELAKRWEEEVD